MNQLLNKLIRHQDLSGAEAEEIFERFVCGQEEPVLVGAVLAALACKGETVEEISSAVKVMRRHMRSIEFAGDILDTCGTGGDGVRTINVSTIVAFLAAAAGVKVAKHGNRAVSSKCGSFDVLEKLGVKIDINTEKAEQCLRQVGITCMFAPNFHPAMKNVAPVRKILGVRTIFNLLGPLLNPARANRQLIGVADETTAIKLGTTLMNLGSKKVITVYSQDGLDEISAAAPTQIFEFSAGQEVKSYFIEPEGNHSLTDLRGGDVVQNAQIFINILRGGGTDAQNEFVALNTAGALVAAGFANDFVDGKKRAYKLIHSGAGYGKLIELIDFSKQ